MSTTWLSDSWGKRGLERLSQVLVRYLIICKWSGQDFHVLGSVQCGLWNTVWVRPRKSRSISLLHEWMNERTPEDRCTDANSPLRSFWSKKEFRETEIGFGEVAENLSKLRFWVTGLRLRLNGFRRCYFNLIFVRHTPECLTSDTIRFPSLSKYCGVNHGCSRQDELCSPLGWRRH